MKSYAAFRTLCIETRAGGQSSRTVITARCGDSLHKSRESRSGDVEWEFRALLGLERPVSVTVGRAIAVGFLVSVLTILTIAIHELGREPPVVRSDEKT